MDYKGDYFPEEEDENSSKTYRIVKRIFKWTMYGISFVLYAFIFILIFINRDSKILEKNYMTDISSLENVDTETIKMYELHTTVFMNEDGSIQVYDVNYAEEYGLLEIGVKFNAKKHTDGDRGDCLEYILTDSNGKSYQLVNSVFDEGGRYGFARICFSDLDIDLDSNNQRYEDKTKPRTDITYTLTVKRKSDKYVLYEFDIYNNSTPFSSTDYED